MKSYEGGKKKKLKNRSLLVNRSRFPPSGHARSKYYRAARVLVYYILVKIPECSIIQDGYLQFL